MARQVKCEVCNTRFAKEGWLHQDMDTGRYVCKSCVKKLKRVTQFNTVGMKQSYITMFIKLLFGISCLIVPEGISETRFLGVVIILWGLIPFLRRKKIRQRHYYLENGTGEIKYYGNNR